MKALFNLREYLVEKDRIFGILHAILFLKY